MSITARVRQFLEHKGMNPNQLAVQAGLKAATVHKALSEGKGLRSDTVAAIVQTFPELDPGWLLTGDGHMLRGTNTKVDTASAPAGNIVVLDIQAAAGYADSNFSAHYLSGKPSMTLPGDQYRGPGLFAIQIAGDSMSPTIYQGDWLVVRKLVSPMRELKEGCVHVVLNAQDGPLAKRLYFGSGKKSLVLRSDNPTYPDQEIRGGGFVAIYLALRLMRDNLGAQGQDWQARMAKLEQNMADLLKGRPK